MGPPDQSLTERKRMEEKLRDSERRYRELSIQDELTGLFNLRFFRYQLSYEMERSNRYAQPLTMLLLDLDKFKRFNDNYGHVAGDEVLTRFGAVVKRCLRQVDTAYRYGGEEFIVLLPMTAKGDGVAAAERIRREFKKGPFFPKEGKSVVMTVSIGLDQYRPNESRNSFVDRVDRFMYEAQRRGRDMVWTE
jgi:diguanylate cyclase (GGDEF)-like protein